MFLPPENTLDRDDDSRSEEVYRSEHCETPLLSITIPTFNRPDMLVETVRSALEQDCCYPFEIVVLDDDPGLWAMRVFSRRCRVWRLPISRYLTNSRNLGMNSDMNRCIKIAR